MNEPLVSILLPTFNRAHLLPAAIRSVFSQSYTNWELIIWDDGSTDNTREVVEKFIDNRIRYFWNTNAGQSRALNDALKSAGGEYIAFLDDDDEWVDSKLSTQISILQKIDCVDLLFSDFVNIDSVTGNTQPCFGQKAAGLACLTKSQVAPNTYLIMDGLLRGILKTNFIGFDTVMIRAQVLDSFNGFNEQLRNAMDLEIWWRMSLAGVRFGYVDEVLMMRKKLRGSLSSPGIATLENHLKCLDICLGYSLSSGCNDLILDLNDAYQRTWQGLIRQYGLLGLRGKAVNAFIQALCYGLSWSAIYEIFTVLAGHQISSRLRGILRDLRSIMLRSDSRV